MQTQNRLKRKQDEADVVLTVKRQRSASTSTASASIAEYDDEHQSDLDTPATPATPTTPATPSRKSLWRPLIYICPYETCGKAFNRPVRLEEHVRSHTNSRPFKCTQDGCEKDFLRQSHLKLHIKSAHTDNRDYACNWTGCDKKFATGTRLKRHQLVHEGQERFKCTAHPPCSQSFRKHATLQRHIDTEHLQLKAFACTQCDFRFDTGNGLRAHEKVFHGGKRHWCTLCSDAAEDDSSPGQGRWSNGFASYSELQDHIQLEHPPCCRYCNLVCASARELERHVDINHAGESLEARKSFICSEVGCGKGFTKQGNLNIHSRTVHGKEKNFICGVTDFSGIHDLEAWDGANACGQAFSAKASLESHIRGKHVSGSGQSRAHNMKKHSRPPQPKVTTSTLTKLTGVGYGEGDRNIACVVPGCPFRFMRQYDLEVHARALHGMLDDDLAEAIAEQEALSGGKFWIGAEDDDDATGGKYGTMPYGGLEQLGPTEVDDIHSQGPSHPLRRFRQSNETHAARNANPIDFEDLNFRALADFCKPAEGVEGGLQPFIDPSLL